jgi:CHAT domain/NACHT domain
MPQPPLKLELCARQAISGATDASSSWLVDVRIGDGYVETSKYLKDPLDQEQRTLCSWYLEQYLLQSPYSGDIAADASSLLTSYAVKILEQLHLKEVVASHFIGLACHDRALLIEVSDDSRADGHDSSTMHQLYWELLEDPAVWDDEGLEVFVQRIIRPLNSPLNTSDQVTFSQRRNGNSSSINVLLVVARDMSRNSSEHSDVSPSLASSVLMEMRQRLQSAGCSLHLSVEIVRPGTITAFEEHLRRSEEIHGPDHFQIVHFDLHGKVTVRKGKDKNQKFGFLNFNSPDMERRHPVLASRIARILKRYRVPIAVLNACESARAHGGNEANIAEVFENHGVHHTLAMSHKISSTAAELFLSTFYERLFLGGLTFASAVRTARYALRSAPTRHARFGAQKELVDWFIPVLYSCGTESVLNVHDWGRSRSITDSINPAVISEDVVIASRIPELLGRGFDILRLENLLLRGRRVYLHGAAGVGKTTFLDYVSTIWQNTAFLDAVVHIDMGKGTTSSAEEIAHAIVRQLLRVGGEEHRSRLWTVSSLALQSYGYETILELIVELVSKLRLAIVLDGLDVAFTALDSSLVPGSLDETETAEVRTLLELIFETPSSAGIYERPYLICAARWPNVERLEKQIGQHFGGNCYELQGLQLVDAIELSHQILRQDGKTMDQWESSDLDSLELVVDLLGGIPAALLELLPAMSIAKVPLGEFYACLHGDQFESVTDLDLVYSSGSSMFHELYHLSLTLPKRIFNFFLFLRRFWCEAPFPKALRALYRSICADTATVYGLDSLAEEYEVCVDLALQFASDRGYLMLGPYGSISWIHPLFTVYCRALALTWPCEFLNDEPRNKAKPRHDMDVSVTKPENQFMMSIQEHSCVHVVIDSLACTNLTHPSRGYSTGVANLLTCIEICLRTDVRAPLEQWPLQLLLNYIEYFNSGRTIAEQKFYSGKYYELVMVFLERNGSNAVKPQYQTFVYSLMNFLSRIHRANSTSLNGRFHEIAELGYDTIAASDQFHGARMIPEIALEKSVILRSRSYSLFLMGRDEEAEDTWRAMMDLDSALCSQFHKGFPGPYKDAKFSAYDENLKILSAILAHLDEEAIPIHNQEFLKILYSQMKESCESRRETENPFLELRELRLRVSEESEVQQKRLDNQRHTTQEMTRYAEKFQLGRLENLSPSSTQMFDMLPLLAQGDRLHLLNALEEARDTGHWMAAVEQHRALLSIAINSHLYEEAFEHIDALDSIYQRSAMFANALPDLARQKQKLEESAFRYKLLSTVFPSAAGGVFGNPLDLAELFTQGLADILPHQSILAKTYWDGLRKENCGSVYPTPISRETFQKVARKYGHMAQDAGWLNNVCHSLEELAGIWPRLKTSWEARDYSACYGLLDKVDELLEKDFISDIMDVALLRHLREGFTAQQSLDRLTSTWPIAISNKDFGTARICLDRFQEDLQDTSFKEKSTDDLSALREYTEDQHWNHATTAIDHAYAADEWSKGEKLCSDLTQLWEEGSFPNFDQESVRRFKSVHLRVLIRQAVNARQWEEGMRLCDKCLLFTEYELVDDPRAQDLELNWKEYCETSRIWELLKEAEAISDFDRCIKLIDRSEEIYERQNQTPERMRSSWYLPPEGHFDDMRRSYLAGRPGTSSRTLKKHPFGCKYHCRGDCYHP